MSLDGKDFSPGMVEELDFAYLSHFDTVDRPARERFLNKFPMVMVQMDAERSVWTPLTSLMRPERLLILPEWKTGQPASWIESKIYLNDGLSTAVIPNPLAREAIERASRRSLATKSSRRISAEGVQAILKEVVLQGGSVLSTQFGMPRIRLTSWRASQRRISEAERASERGGMSTRVSLQPGVEDRALSAESLIRAFADKNCYHDYECPARGEDVADSVRCDCGLAGELNKLLAGIGALIRT